MRITDDEVEEFRKLYREERQIDLSPDEARAAIHRVLALFEHFAVWLGKERAAGRHSRH